LNIPGTSSVSKNTLDLKNPFFRYNGQTPAIQPGTQTTSPSDAYWNSLMTGSWMFFTKRGMGSGHFFFWGKIYTKGAILGDRDTWILGQVKGWGKTA